MHGSDDSSIIEGRKVQICSHFGYALAYFHLVMGAAFRPIRAGRVRRFEAIPATNLKNAWDTVSCRPALSLVGILRAFRPCRVRPEARIILPACGGPPGGRRVGLSKSEAKFAY